MKRARIRKSAPAPELSVSGSATQGAFQCILTEKSLTGALFLPVGPDVVGWSFALGREGQLVAKAADVVVAARSFSFLGDRFARPLQKVAAVPRVWKNSTVEQVIKDGPLPGGGGALTIAKPTIEHGIHTDAFHEYFVTKANGLNGIVVLRQKEGGWSASVSKTLVPYVLSKDALADGIMPPEGMSALPTSLERVVPVQYQYWKASGADAIRMRKELAESGFFDDRLLKVVDGEIRLCVERLFLFEPDPEPGPGTAPTTKGLSAVAKNVLAILPAEAPVASPIAESEDPRAWGGLITKADKPGSILVLSPPIGDGAAELVKALAATKADWLIDVNDSPSARAELAPIAPIFKVAGDDDRLFAASFKLASTEGITFVSGPHRDLRKADNISFEELSRALRDAITEKFPSKEGEQGCCGYSSAWVVDTFDDFVIYEHEGKLWRLNYQFANGAVTLGPTPEQVMRSYVPASQAGTAPAPTPAPGAENKAAKAAVAKVELRKLAVRKEGERRYVLGIVLEPETVDAQKDVYSADEVENAAHVFMEQYRNTGLMHEKMVNDKVKILQSYIAPADMTIGTEAVKKGTWLMAVHVLDDDLWASVKSEGLTGFSIGGSAIRRPA
jgi:hypothetical protein